MENAADALKIAFAMFVLVIAITITFSLVSQAKSTADVVLYHGDETNFYEYSYSRGENEKNRIVSVTEIIPTLYRYCNESISVEIRLKDLNNTTYIFDLGNLEYLVEKEENVYKKQFDRLDRQKNLAKFIDEILLDELKDETFEEQFVEIPIRGIYEYGEDGTELAISSGGKKVYITYIKQ